MKKKLPSEKKTNPNTQPTQPRTIINRAWIPGMAMAFRVRKLYAQKSKLLDLKGGIYPSEMR